MTFSGTAGHVIRKLESKYVIRKLETKYVKLKNKEGTECVKVLNEMAKKMSSHKVTSSNHQASEWTSLIDRGGLYYVEDIVYYLFIALDLIIDKELTTIFEKKGKGIEKVKKEKLSWVCDDDDVQFIWCMVSPSTIVEESVRQKTSSRYCIHMDNNKRT